MFASIVSHSKKLLFDFQESTAIYTKGLSMLLGDNERFIIKCDFDLQPFPEGAPAMHLKNCMPTLSRLVKEDKASYEINKGRSAVRLLKVEEHTQHYLMLVQYANMDASDPAFANVKTGESRVAKKQLDEGLGVTCHIVIRKEPISEVFPNTYTAVIEEIPGITRALLAQALTSWFKEANFTFKKPDGKKDLICRPIVNIDFQASQTLEKTLSTGYLAGITAIRHVASNSMDEEGLVTIEEEILKITTKFKRGEQAVKAIKVAYDKLRGMNYSVMRISYRDSNKRTGTDSLKLDAERSLKELATAQLANRDKVILAVSIGVCQTTFHDELASKMVKFMIK